MFQSNHFDSLNYEAIHNDVRTRRYRKFSGAVYAAHAA